MFSILLHVTINYANNLKSFATWQFKPGTNSNLKYSYNFPIFIYINVFCRWNFRKARHGHNFSC